MGVLKLGFVTTYMSDPLIAGFTTGTAVHVGTSQVKYIFGLKIPRTDGLFQVIKVTILWSLKDVYDHYKWHIKQTLYVYTCNKCCLTKLITGFVLCFTSVNARNVIILQTQIWHYFLKYGKIMIIGIGTFPQIHRKHKNIIKWFNKVTKVTTMFLKVLYTM